MHLKRPFRLDVRITNEVTDMLERLCDVRRQSISMVVRSLIIDAIVELDSKAQPPASFLAGVRDE